MFLSRCDSSSPVVPYIGRARRKSLSKSNCWTARVGALEITQQLVWQREN